MKTSYFVVSILGLFLASANARGACMRLVSLPHRPELDGPGAFSPLQDTLTLDCLVFTGTIVHGKEIVAVVQDERGAIYKVARWNYLGENTGRVVEITATRIKVLQVVRDENGNQIQVPRYLFLGQDNRI
jgi:hypothetical protein